MRIGNCGFHFRFWRAVCSSGHRFLACFPPPPPTRSHSSLFFIPTPYLSFIILISPFLDLSASFCQLSSRLFVQTLPVFSISSLCSLMSPLSSTPSFPLKLFYMPQPPCPASSSFLHCKSPLPSLSASIPAFLFQGFCLNLLCSPSQVLLLSPVQLSCATSLSMISRTNRVGLWGEGESFFAFSLGNQNYKFKENPAQRKQNLRSF